MSWISLSKLLSSVRVLSVCERYLLSSGWVLQIKIKHKVLTNVVLQKLTFQLQLCKSSQLWFICMESWKYSLKIQYLTCVINCQMHSKMSGVLCIIWQLFTVHCWRVSVLLTVGKYRGALSDATCRNPWDSQQVSVEVYLYVTVDIVQDVLCENMVVHYHAWSTCIVRLPVVQNLVDWAVNSPRNLGTVKTD